MGHDGFARVERPLGPMAVALGGAGAAAAILPAYDVPLISMILVALTTGIVVNWSP